MTNEEIETFGNALVATLEIGDTDKNGNKHPDHEAYLVEIDRQANNATVNYDPERPF